MNTAQAGFTATTSNVVEPRTEARSMAWLAVAVALAILTLLVLGTMAEARWCGPELCDEQVEMY